MLPTYLVSVSGNNNLFRSTIQIPKKLIGGRESFTRPSLLCMMKVITWAYSAAYACLLGGGGRPLKPPNQTWALGANKRHALSSSCPHPLMKTFFGFHRRLIFFLVIHDHRVSRDIKLNEMGPKVVALCSDNDIFIAICSVSLSDVVQK